MDLVRAQLSDDEPARLVVRTDTAACTHAFLPELTDRALGYTDGFYTRANVAAAVEAHTEDDFWPAIDADGVVRDGLGRRDHRRALAVGLAAGHQSAGVQERPHPGAQLHLTDASGRITCFATNHTSPDLPALELWQRRRARCEDGIRNAKDTGLSNLHYHDKASNQL